MDDEFAQDTTFRRLWIELLALYPEAEDTAKVINDDDDTRQYLQRRAEDRGGTLRTLSGVVVKSMQEQRIANWLWLNSITFEYEKQLAYTDTQGETQHFHPDFFYPHANAFHEHLAIGADGTSPFEGYVEQAERKRQAFRGENVDFFETTSAMADTDELTSFIERQLVQRGVDPSPRSADEILKAIEPTVVKRFQNLISVSIKHIRSNGLTVEMLLEQAKTLRDPRRAQRFTIAIAHLTEAYSRKLAQAGRIDFDSMIGDATTHVQSGRYQSPYSLILIDEFQDISDARANLVKALRQQHPNSKVFAVGDDWQAIYRFAGSDVTIFTQFTEQFGISWQGKLQQTHRSNQAIADAAAGFVQRNPGQLRKNVRSTRPGIPHSIRLIPIDVSRDKASMEKRCIQLLRRLDDFAAARESSWQSEPSKKLKVLVLARYNRTIALTLDGVEFTHIEVGRMTFHRSKGIEADYTILLDVSEGEYGVPSLIQDDELLHLVLPRPEEFPYAEERRLFYVAMTRAIRGVFILFEKGNPSRYIHELVEVAPQGVRFETPEGMELRPCTRCRKGFLVNRRSKAGNAFLGCDRFPVCEQTANV